MSLRKPGLTVYEHGFLRDTQPALSRPEVASGFSQYPRAAAAGCRIVGSGRDAAGSMSLRKPGLTVYEHGFLRDTQPALSRPEVASGFSQTLGRGLRVLASP
jgi:hypothetical protein